MTDMLHIARSGVLASRMALSVTAENVANAGTEGYRRRDVSTITASGGQTTPLTLPTGGQGVTVTEVRRAFDHLVAERGRNAVSAQTSTFAHQGVAESLEARLVPGETGLDGTTRAFFDSLTKLAASPADMTSRTQTLRLAEALSNDMAETAAGFVQLRSDTVAQAGLAASEAQDILRELNSLNTQMAQMGAGQPIGNHPLADRRDALLTNLAQRLPVAVTLMADGRPEIRLGSDAGPILLDRTGPARLTISALDRLTLHIIAADGAMQETRMLGAGRLGGLAMGIGAIDMARQEFDIFARNMVEGLNNAHRGGVDLTGRAGQDLFDLRGWTATPSTANAGQVQVQVTLGGAQSLSGPLALVYDAGVSEWQARDGNGQLLATGRDQLILPGLTVDLAGAARNGDRIILTPTTGRALDMRLSITDPRALAPSAAVTVAPAMGNAGVAKLQMHQRADGAALDAVDLVVTDAGIGQVELRAILDDTVLASGALGADGRVTLAGFDLQLTGVALGGDRFTLRATGQASGNGDVAQSMAGLRRAQGVSGGVLDQLSQFLGDIGTRSAATQRSSDTAQARLDSAEREDAALGAVNLDMEAARMVELQQSYQASAQALSIARSLFDTLLRMI